MFGGKSTVRGATSGIASSVAFTPLQGLEIVNPMAAEKRVQEVHIIMRRVGFLAVVYRHEGEGEGGLLKFIIGSLDINVLV